MYSVETTKRFDKDVKRCLKRGLNIQLVYDAIEAAPTTTGGRRSVNLSRQQIINIDYATVHILDDDSCGRNRWLHKNG